MLRSLLAVSVLVLSVHARVFNTLVFNPRATSQPEHDDLLLPPDPTPAAVALPELLRRDTVVTAYLAPDNTCGYISGLAGAEYYCLRSTAKCAFLTADTGYGELACCNSQECAAVTACVDYVQFSILNECDNGCQKNTYTLKCTSSSYPYCNSILFPDQSITDYFCDATSVSSYQIAYTTYNGERDGRTFDPLPITLTSAGEKSSSSAAVSSAASSSDTYSTTSSSHPSKTTSSSTPSTTSSAGGFGIGSQTTTPPAVSSTSSGSTPVGAIVGGSVGGFALIAIVAVLIFFIRNKRKAKAVDTVQPPFQQPVQQSVQQPPPVQQPLYALPRDSNNPADMAATAGNLPPGHPPMEYYGSKPQEPYQGPPMSQVFEQPPLQQQYPSALQVPELQDGNLYTLPPEQRVWSSSPTNSGQSPNAAYSMSTGPTSPNSLTHLSAAYNDLQNGNSPTISQSQRNSNFIPTTPNSPMPTYAAYRPPQPGVVEMSANLSSGPSPQQGTAEIVPNMSSGPFPQDLHQGTFEVPGSEAYRPQGSD